MNTLFFSNNQIVLSDNITFDRSLRYCYNTIRLQISLQLEIIELSLIYMKFFNICMIIYGVCST